MIPTASLRNVLPPLDINMTTPIPITNQDAGFRVLEQFQFKAQ